MAFTRLEWLEVIWHNRLKENDGRINNASVGAHACSNYAIMVGR